MNFFERLRRAIHKIKGKLIVSAILLAVIIFFGVAPFSVAVKDGIMADDSYFNWQIFFENLGTYIVSPGTAFGLCFKTEPINYLEMFFTVTKWFMLFYGLFVFVGICKAFPKHEYQDIENGSSDWSENGEQYKVLHRSKGIVLAEKNYLPVDKRGNVNVLVVRRFWCW